MSKQLYRIEKRPAKCGEAVVDVFNGAFPTSVTAYICDVLVPVPCTELHTEQQMRAIANHLLFACDESVKAYCCEMSDENWSRLMAEVNT